MPGRYVTKHKLVRCFARHVERAFLEPETERVKDVWNLVAFGLSGNLSFTRISQRWLRETAKRWAADDLPKRRGKDAAAPVRHYLVSVAALSDSLRATRADRGDDPSLLGRADIDSFLHRLAFLTGDGRLSTDARIRICREVRHLLGRFRALGLTRAGGPAAGLGEDFALARSDVPRQAEDPEPNRDLPTEIMRQLCEHLPVLEQDISSREVRVAVELIIDTGRRPDEICALRLGLPGLRRADRSPVLVYDNHKNARLGRRLPIGQATADLITGQKDRVRARFPDTAPGQLKLLPAAYANPHGRRSISETQLGERHRTWIDALPALLRDDGTEYDKTRIVPYAYRHSYAQRHADAGVPIDVLRHADGPPQPRTPPSTTTASETSAAARPSTGSPPAVRPARQPDLAPRPGTAGLRARPPRDRRGRRPVRGLRRTVQRPSRRQGLPVPVPLRRLRPLPHRRLLPARPARLPR